MSGAAPSRAARELGLAVSLWKREMLRLARERMRWTGAVMQPLLFWFIIGSGMADSFAVPGRPDVDSLKYFFPGILVMVVLFTSIFTTISVVEDRQAGFLQGVLVAPGSRLSLVIGKIAGVVTLTLLQCTVFVVLAPLAGFSLPEVRWGALAAVVIVAATGLTGGCFVMAWRLGSVQSYHAVMSVLLIPLWFLSGALFPPPDNWIRGFMVVNPLTYAVDGVRGALSEDALGVQGVLGTRAGPLAESLLVLGLFAVAMVAAAAIAARRPASRPE